MGFLIPLETLLIHRPALCILPSNPGNQLNCTRSPSVQAYFERKS